jgi:hypothetical protein
MLIKIMFSGKNTHLICWIFSKGLYGKLGWGFVGRSDMCFNVRIGNNKIRDVRSEKGRKYLKLMI